jgi:hypothetical protein
MTATAAATTAATATATAVSCHSGRANAECCNGR